MDGKDAAAASDFLWRLWADGGVAAGLPDGLRPADRRAGYAIQACLERRSARPIAGWKIAATSEAGQRHINVDGPIAGRLLAERVDRDGATVPFGANRMAVAEPEFCFRFGRRLAPRPSPYAVEEVLDAVEALHLAVEIPDSRFADFTVVGAPSLIADDACAHRFVLGPAAPATWRASDLVTHRVVGRVSRDGRTVLEREGSGAAVLGDPRRALAWLVGEVTGLDLAIEVGQIVTTGTCVVPLTIRPGDEVTADFGGFGAVSCRIGD